MHLPRMDRCQLDRGNSPGSGRIQSDGSTYLQALQPFVGRAEAQKIFAQVSLLSEDYLQRGLTMPKQQREQVRRLVDCVCDKYPVFRHFEREWPLHKYLTNCYRRKRSGGKIVPTDHGCLASWPRQPVYDLPEPSAPDQVSACPSIAAGSKGAASTVQCSITTRIQPATPEVIVIDDDEDPPSTSIPALTSFLPSYPSCSFGSLSSAGGGSSQSIQSFLRGLDPNLAHCWPVFDEYGIRLRGDLEAFGRWSRERQESVLGKFVSSGRLTEFECEVILHGIQSRSGES